MAAERSAEQPRIEYAQTAVLRWLAHSGPRQETMATIHVFSFPNETTAVSIDNVKRQDPIEVRRQVDAGATPSIPNE
jgi:hypothetical protein